MKADHKVYFYGTDAVGDEQVDVMRRVQQLLKLSEHHLLSLFNKPEGVVLYHTPDKEKAERLVRKLVAAGAHAELSGQPETKSPSSADNWELVGMDEDTTHIFHCGACLFSERLPLSTPLPAICPECGVVAAKYAHVAQQKQKRERIRKSIIDQEKAKAEQHDAAEVRADEAALRREIERNVRRELGIASPVARRVKAAALAAGVFAIGVLSTVGISHLWSSLDGTSSRMASVESDRRHLRTPAEATKTVNHASTVATQLTGKNWHQVVDVPIALSPTPGATEPWIDAPPTAAGNRTASNPTAAPAMSAARQSASGNDNVVTPRPVDAEMEILTSAWYRPAMGDPLKLARLQRLGNDLIDSSHVEQALNLADWVDVVHQRLDLLDQASFMIATTGDAILVQRARTALRARIDNADAADTNRVVDLLALDNLAAMNTSIGDDQGLTRTEIAAQILKLINDGQRGANERVRLHTLSAIHYARRAGAESAERWFAEVNHALAAVEGPADRLIALARLAGAYQTSGDALTAERLVRRVEAGGRTLDPQLPATREVNDALLRAHLATAHFDAALDNIARNATSTLHADLARAHLAIELAARRQGTVARGVIATIGHPVARARANARIAAVETLNGRYAVAQLFSDAARNDLRDQSPAIIATIASDLSQPLPDELASAVNLDSTRKRSREDAQSDHRRSIIATNLAWNGADNNARLSAQRIADKAMRDDVQRRIDTLARYQGAAAVGTLVATRDTE